MWFDFLTSQSLVESQLALNTLKYQAEGQNTTEIAQQNIVSPDSAYKSVEPFMTSKMNLTPSMIYFPATKSF